VIAAVLQRTWPAATVHQPGEVGVRRPKMRHLLTKLVAVVFVVGLAIGFGQAYATPRPILNGLASQATPVEKAHYYGYRYRGYGGYYPYYNYWPYWYYRPYFYGYRYQPYYRNFGYQYRPHHHRHHR
jgi:hypothetical protein